MIKSRISRAGYLNGQSILKNVDLHVKEGECVLITGPSGSGKTTLLLSLVGVINNVLNGYVEGEVSIGGLNPLVYDDFVKLPREVGVVLQEPDKQIAMPTPMEEVLFTMENLGFEQDYSVKRAMEMLKHHGLLHKACMHVENLSLGEKRRVTLVSSTIHEPNILLLDEPSASMDPHGIKIIRDFIRENVRRGRTVVIVEHKEELFLDLADSLYVMRGGTLFKAEGEPRVDYNALIEKPRSRNETSGSVVVKTTDLTVGYGGSPLILGIDLEVRRGESIALIGPNGSGKSTLLKTILGFLRPMSGELVVRGRAFYVPQEPDYMFLGRTVMDELKLIERKVKVRKEAIIAEHAWLRNVLEKAPHVLSHGQKRALSILIALQYKPDVLLLDEPTSGLDDLNVKWVIDALAKLRERGASSIIATHDPRVFGLVDRVLMIDNFRIREVSRDKAVEWFIRNALH